MRVGIAECFESVSEQLGLGPIVVDYHPYAELKHTWRQRRGMLEFKISDYLRDAPEGVNESLAWHLLSHAAHTKCPDGRRDPYLSYAKSRELWLRNRDRYLSRARNLMVEPRGSARDLRTVFDYVNANYFSGRLRNPILAWSNESPRQRLGFYFEPLNLMAVNRVLDSERVPRYVLEFVVYHELLHHVDAVNGRRLRRIHHTKRFKAQERAFSSYDEAERWLMKLASKKRREV